MHPGQPTPSIPQVDAGAAAATSADAVTLTAGSLRLVAPLLPGSRLDHVRTARNISV